MLCAIAPAGPAVAPTSAPSAYAGLRVQMRVWDPKSGSEDPITGILELVALYLAAESNIKVGIRVLDDFWTLLGSRN
jgi:hypothetical protein